MKYFFTSDLHFGHKNILKYEEVRLRMTYDRLLKEKASGKVLFYVNDYLDSFELFKTGYFNACNVLQEARDSSQAEVAKNLIYECLKAHDEAIIDNWNSVVSAEDVVWFLGDICINPGKAKNYIPKLNGYKKMIIGNHDGLGPERYKEFGFTTVSKYPVLIHNKFLLTHYPIQELFDDNHLFQIYGHVHGNTEFATRTENTICVCLERHDMKPIEIPEFTETIK